MPVPAPRPQPEELTNVLEICNVVFTSMFALEMLLKLAAFGLFDYLRNPYNIFDSIIVIIRCPRRSSPGCGPGGRGGKRGWAQPVTEVPTIQGAQLRCRTVNKHV